MDNVQQCWGEAVPTEKSHMRSTALPHHMLSIPMMRERFLSQSIVPTMSNSQARSQTQHQFHPPNQARETPRRSDARTQRQPTDDLRRRSSASIGREHAVMKPHKRKAKVHKGERSSSVKRESGGSVNRNFKYLLSSVILKVSIDPP